MKLSDPLRFEPILKRALWGGSRLECELQKAAGGVSDAAESWEVADLPGNVSVVISQGLQGQTLRDLMERLQHDLLGAARQPVEQFPILVKFLDAQHQLSIQVHPKDPIRLPNGKITPGKAEAWIVIDAVPGNRMYLGLKEGVNESQLRCALETGNLEDCLHTYEAHPGDCIYLAPGTVHALGGGLLIAEIQQPSDLTYRLHDWGRLDAEGRPRELHIEQGIAATNFQAGPVQSIVPQVLPGRAGSELLIDSPHFVIKRHRGTELLKLPDDDTMHIFVVLHGTAMQEDFCLKRGETAVIPAARTHSTWQLSEGCVLIDAHLP